MSDPQRIRYRFDLPDGSQKSLDLAFGAADFRLSNAAPAAPPFWTALTFNQCANCPLSAADHPHCPAALQMASAVELLKALVSFDTVGVTVTQAERTVYAETTAQQAMSSVLGLIMATAGCPWTDRLRPMARRLGAATRTDPAQNAMALLDAYTTLLPAALESSLEELKPLFDAW